MPGFQPYPRPYEIVVLISPDFTDEALDETVDSVARLIAEHGGTVTHVKRDTPWGRRRLVYPIQRHRDATYVLYNFTSSPSSIVTFERDLKLDERVIRYLIVRDESKPAADGAAEGEEAGVEAEGESAGAGAEGAEAAAVEASSTPESDQAVAEAPTEEAAAAPIDAETATVVEDGDEVEAEAAEEPADEPVDAETEHALEHDQEQEAEPEPGE